MTDHLKPILIPDDDRFVVLPVKYQHLYQMYKSAVDWVKMTKDEKYFISLILAFFTCMDGLINENLAVRFFNEVQNLEVRLFYGFQMVIERIHQEVYANLIDNYYTPQ
jgi:ribonucleotide reductase beta subunit family protein with ferritin-like domain